MSQIKNRKYNDKNLLIYMASSDQPGCLILIEKQYSHQNSGLERWPIKVHITQCCSSSHSFSILNILYKIYPLFIVCVKGIILEKLCFIRVTEFLIYCEILSSIENYSLTTNWLKKSLLNPH